MFGSSPYSFLPDYSTGASDIELRDIRHLKSCYACQDIDLDLFSAINRW